MCYCDVKQPHIIIQSVGRGGLKYKLTRINIIYYIYKEKLRKIFGGLEKFFGMGD